VQLGWGSRQRRIQAAETDRTSAVSEAIAQDKELTKALLHAAGVPVPRGRSVDDVEDAAGLAAWKSVCRSWSSRATATRARA
jgi:cyanophycin synthetase